MTTIVASRFITRRAAPSQRAGEGIVGGEIGELVPFVVDRVDEALVGARQRAFELQIVRRIGEDEVDAGLGERVEFGDAVADEDRRRAAAAPTVAGRLARLRPVRKT